MQDGKDGALLKWKPVYTPMDLDGQGKSDRMTGILENILNGNELVGAFESQAVSNIFPPSGMCFNGSSF